MLVPWRVYIYIFADGIPPVFLWHQNPQKNSWLRSSSARIFHRRAADFPILYTKARISMPFIYIYIHCLYISCLCMGMFITWIYMCSATIYIYTYTYIYIRYVYYQICFKACKTTIHIISALRSVVLGARCWISKCWAWRERRKQKARLVPGRCSI